MHSVKPGRGPALFGVLGGIIIVAFGIFWTVTVSQTGAPPFMVLFGILFVLLAIGGVIYNLYNATQKDRMSVYDVTTDREEPDPLSRALGHAPGSPRESAGGDRFCPSCGDGLKPGFNFCPKCGKRI